MFFSFLCVKVLTEQLNKIITFISKFISIVWTIIPQTGNSFRIPKHPPKLRLYTSHLRKHPHYTGTVEYHHAPSVKQLIPSVESSGSRRRVDHGRSVDGGGSDVSDNGGNSFFRTMLGVPSYCLAGIEGDLESKCVLTPVCWLNGGIPHPGCNSMLYTCCVDAALSRKVRGRL